MTFSLRLAVIGLCVALVVGQGAGLYWSLTRKAAVEAERDSLVLAVKQAAKQRQADAALLARRAQENAVAARESASLRAQLDKALAAQPEWANQPVPQEVRDALEQ
jgi:hypothetical protein